MEKKELVKFLDEIFVPLNFKRKGNNWVSNGETVNRIINLQKSQYSNAFYINYGYILNSLPLDNWTSHVDNRLGGKEKEEQKLITDLLNLESDFKTEERFYLLGKIINEKIVKEVQFVSSEEDVLKILKEKEFLYTIPPAVLRHFNLTL
ncbi:DUF4304 domain-containing protein [Flavobacterium tructae]|uniref:DUF4304 domain-containing protein n=1 Tax=Flavobacterium tructae TaxID=1114873 RepID=UPI002551FE30|nr:DUF4304 domain-containing protein [Flavobacterium tructae]MDL2141628.1 DUF4304 domain-containing protein [Flavobacterium tructae]